MEGVSLFWTILDILVNFQMIPTLRYLDNYHFEPQVHSGNYRHYAAQQNICSEVELGEDQSWNGEDYGTAFSSSYWW